LENNERKDIDKGPEGWLIPVLESAYTKLTPREQNEEQEAEFEEVEGPIIPPGSSMSRLQPGHNEEVLSNIGLNFWEERLKQYQQRKAAVTAEESLNEGMAMPAQPTTNNWIPIGPEVVAHGQAIGNPPVGGRVSRIAIFTNGNRIYAATANGGVFRSDDGGISWMSTMDGFDTDPTHFASTSLAAGSIAISSTDPDRVYVGTGEGDTDTIFRSRITHALPTYRGIGPIISEDGGDTWITEPSAPSLAGFAFYELAVDPFNHENVVAATTNGLYQRTLNDSSPLWQQRRSGVYCSVVVSKSDPTITTFYAAAWGGPIYKSRDGLTWSIVGTNFPSSNVGRIAIGTQSDNTDVLYALVVNVNGGQPNVYRLDATDEIWRRISNVPNIVLGSQGDYDLCIAVDPNDINIIYLGGDRTDSPPWPANIQRCIVSKSGSNYSVTSTSIGENAHADVHFLVFEPGNSDRLWAGTDGGCFLNKNASGAGKFEGHNTGLSSLNTNYMGMSSSEPAIIYCGLQDNGTARYLGEELWYHVSGGDGGYCIVHPTKPFHVLVYANGSVYKTTKGGHDENDWRRVFGGNWAIMAEPLVKAPESERVAIGSGSTIHISDDFGTTWPSNSTNRINLQIGAGAGIFSMVFANENLLFVGTTNGRVYRVDIVNGVWSTKRLDNTSNGSLGLTGLISDIAIDWSDPTNQSIYICFGGNGDFRHVWRFDGVRWEPRSGSGISSLIDVEHNAIVVDPLNPSHVYVGADIGVWNSVDSGNNWTLLQNGLPDAPIFDLQIQNEARLLRASTHGRGLYEYHLDSLPLNGRELYIRHTFLDIAKNKDTDGKIDPSKWPAGITDHKLSPNIKIDVPSQNGYSTPSNKIDFFQFHESVMDGRDRVATTNPPIVIKNRVYVLVHNRGPFTANSVRVYTAITNASTAINPLPTGYTTNIQQGTLLTGPDWITLGSIMLTNLRPGFPQVAAFDLPSTLLPTPGNLSSNSNFCLLAFVHSPEDPFTTSEQDINILANQDRKTARKDFKVVKFIGTPHMIETN